jgi:hypothetical protein
MIAGKTAEGTYVKTFFVVGLNDSGLMRAIKEYLIIKVIIPATIIKVQII